MFKNARPFCRAHRKCHQQPISHQRVHLPVAEGFRGLIWSRGFFSIPFDPTKKKTQKKNSRRENTQAKNLPKKKQGPSFLWKWYTFASYGDAGRV